MTALVLAQRPAALPGSPIPWNWPRVGALSGALWLHFAALALLLAPPAAMRLPPVRQPITEAHLIDTPPKIEEPPLPVPPKFVREIRQKPVPQPVRETVAPPVAESPMRSEIADPAPLRADATPPAPTEVAPVALAYHTRTKIPYPRDAFQMRQQGTVILRVLVGTDGVPQSVQIETSSGSRSLDNAARDAVKKWTFQAGTRNGIPAPLWARVPISFTLQLL